MGFPPHSREWLSIVDITYVHEPLDPGPSFHLEIQLRRHCHVLPGYIARTIPEIAPIEFFAGKNL